MNLKNFTELDTKLKKFRLLPASTFKVLPNYSRTFKNMAFCVDDFLSNIANAQRAFADKHNTINEKELISYLHQKISLSKMDCADLLHSVDKKSLKEQKDAVALYHGIKWIADLEKFSFGDSDRAFLYPQSGLSLLYKKNLSDAKSVLIEVRKAFIAKSKDTKSAKNSKTNSKSTIEATKYILLTLQHLHQTPLAIYSLKAKNGKDAKEMNAYAIVRENKENILLSEAPARKTFRILTDNGLKINVSVLDWRMIYKKLHKNYRFIMLFSKKALWKSTQLTRAEDIFLSKLSQLAKNLSPFFKHNSLIENVNFSHWDSKIKKELENVLLLNLFM